ncbi:DUF6402 family protein [Cupriavidus sp.]|uniref:DUF6402 family protein n=1 Tax=Cupriavidus sp. TaxID=1873897 RepID=UPI0031E19EC6
MSIATSNLSPKDNRQGAVVKVDQMYLDEIPGAMDKMGWRVSAALMRRWFATKPAWVMGPEDRVEADVLKHPASRVDNRLITMKWLLSHESVLPDGQFKLPHLWSGKFPQAGRVDYASAFSVTASLVAASLRR